MDTTQQELMSQRDIGNCQQAGEPAAMQSRIRVVADPVTRTSAVAPTGPEFRNPEFDLEVMSHQPPSNADALVEWPTWAQPHGSTVIARMLNLLQPCQVGSLDLTDSLRDWQKVWEATGRLPSLMAATIPDISQSGNSKATERAFEIISSSSVNSWPMIGLEITTDYERTLMNRQIVSTGRIDALTFKATFKRMLGVSRRPGPHTFMCISLGLDAPLYSWLLTWRDIGVLRALQRTLEERVQPVWMSAVISESEIINLHRKSTTEDATHFQIEVVCSDYWQHKTTNRKPFKTGSLIFRAESIEHHRPVTLRAIAPLDTVGLSCRHGFFVTKASPWCPLSIISATATQRKGNNLTAHPFSAMGMRFSPSIVNEQPWVPHEAIDAVPSSRIDEDGLNGCDVLPEDLSMPGVIPSTWIVTTEVQGSSQVARQLELNEAVINSLMFEAGLEMRLYRESEWPEFRNPKFHDESLDRFGSLSVEINAAHQLQEKTVLMTAPATAFANAEGSTYRIPLISLALEEASLLNEWSDGTSRSMTKGACINPSLKLSTNRRSLHLFKRIITTLERSGVGPYRMREMIRSIILDLEGGFGNDIFTRYQLVRVSQTSYQIAALPFWSRIETRSLKCQQLSIFGGSILFSDTAWSELSRNERMLALVARQTSISLDVLTQAIADARSILSKHARKYTSLIEQIELDNSASKFRTPKFSSSVTPSSSTAKQERDL